MSNMPVLELILDRLPATLLLMAQPASSLLDPLGWPHVLLGTAAELRCSTTFDHGTLLLASFAVPVFWLGQLLILAFGYYLDWLPTQGMVDLRAGYTGFDLVLDVARHMVLSLTLTFIQPGADPAPDTRQHASEVVGRICQGRPRQRDYRRIP